ncbi:MAG: hypothetical protein KDA61_02785, partial [Planctomycetales bacterium]|nr:hypothetical protein [Planctomycetales bacterium]
MLIVRCLRTNRCSLRQFLRGLAAATLLLALGARAEASCGDWLDESAMAHAGQATAKDSPEVGVAAAN